MLQLREQVAGVKTFHLRDGFDDIFPARAHRFVLKKASFSHISAQILAQNLEVLLQA
jgi:hypothetical protein